MTVKCIKNAYGTKKWYKDGKYHRISGPAIVWLDGTNFWYRDGKPHREAGAAVEWCNGDKEWWFYGFEAQSEEEFYSDEFRKNVYVELL